MSCQWMMLIVAVIGLVVLATPLNALASIDPKGQHERRDFVKTAFMLGGGVVAAAQNSQPAWADLEGVVTPILDSDASTTTSKKDSEGVTLYTTKSGLKYIELREGDETTPSPRYGQLLSIAYTSYVKLPGNDEKLQKFDTVGAYVIKHGNGRNIPGLDEGLHTMKVGGKRRLIIPPKLGYVAPGLGPIPVSPLGRYQLNNLLDKMVEKRGGNVIIDVELRLAMNDEADQGYYDDSSLSPEQFQTLRENLQDSAKRAISNKES